MTPCPPLLYYYYAITYGVIEFMKKKISAIIACLFPFAMALTQVSAANDSSSSASSAPAGQSNMDLYQILFWVIVGAVGVILLIVIVNYIRTAVRRIRYRFSSGVMSLVRQLVESHDEPTKETNISKHKAPMDYTSRITPTIRRDDKYFNSDSFIEYAKSTFGAVQSAVTNRDCSMLKGIETAQLLEQHESLINQLISKKQINIMNNAKIEPVYLHKYECNTKFERLTVYMFVQMVAYTIEEDTQNVVAGSISNICDNEYFLTFTRKAGVKTPKDNTVVSQTCPSCGASINITNQGLCEYCGSNIAISDFGWALSNIELINEMTLIDNRGLIINK